ncbi:peptidoglycan DD-metalloendopeptidase family protein [Clavibacter tessellarius]|uniref:peptidoglycan DD-metalloendopeptidase family protein n=1 Tax=Clavibacter tessellarius TaxID=31965 RepID=UPI00324C6C99
MNQDLHRSARRSRAPRSRTRHGIQAVVAVLAVLLTGSIAAPAHADTFASWDDVQKARGDEQAQQRLVQSINDEIASLQQRVADAQALVVQRGDEHDKAQQDADDKHAETVQLQEKVDAADAKATKSQEQAAGLAKQLMRSGGQNLSGTLLLSEGDGTDDLLDKLGTMSKVAEKSDQIYAIAIQDRNAAKSLSDQAQVALKEARRAERQGRAAPRGGRAGAVRPRAGARGPERAEGRRRREALRHHREPRGHRGRLPGGRPQAPGRRRRPRGQPGRRGRRRLARHHQRHGLDGAPPGREHERLLRHEVPPHPAPHDLPRGEDLVRGSTCGATQYAAHSGTVSFAGWNGGYGNYIRIDHGNGVSSAYGHIMDGGTLVRNGQQVVAGQPIARTGTTGGSTGCHLHFEIRINGNAVDPVAFMHGQGVSITSTH